MPCISPRIIINPHYINNTHIYCELVGFHKTYYVSRGRFDFSYFHPASRHVTLEDLDKYYAVDPVTGDSIPVYISVPCGHCDGCRLSKRYNLRNRMILEQVGRKTPMYFVTLTYNDEHLPSEGVCVRDCQLFFKRFRERLSKQFNYNVPFRYILFSEYGKLHHRPHYHFILFGFDFDIVSKDFQKIESWLSNHCWQNGFVRVMSCDSGAFNYVSKYVLKGSNVPQGKCPNFTLSSRGSGGIGCACLSVPSIVKQIADGCTSVSVSVFGKIYEFPVPKQIYNYCYRNNIQSLRRKYMKHVKQFFSFASALSNLYQSRFLDSSYRSTIDYMDGLAKSICGVSILKPRDVVKIAPYAPEVSFWCNDESSNRVTTDMLEFACDNAIRNLIYISSFDLENYPDFVCNSDLLSKFVTRISLKVAELYDGRTDFSDNSAVYSSNLSRLMIDNCRDCQ